MPNSVVYGFRVPAEASGYVFAAGSRSGAAAYQGEFHVNEPSAQVSRIDLSVPEPPVSSGLVRVASEIEYGRRTVGGASNWLPVKVRIEAEMTNGSVARKRLAFRTCRSFQVETSVVYDDRDGPDFAAKRPAKAVAVPAGLDLRLELTDSISSDRSWAGDLFSAKLYKSAKADGKTILPEGAEILGRIIGLETIDATRGSPMKDFVRRWAVVSLVLIEARWDGRCAPLAATMQIVERIPVMKRIYPGGAADLTSATISTNRAAAYDTSSKMSRPGLGTFVVHGELYLVRKGTRMRWTTEPSSDAPCRNGSLKTQGHTPARD